jgi:selenocysteine lyase/cysteine desulfurase
MDRLRGKLGKLVNAPGKDIAFFPNAASALSLLLGGLDWRPGDEVVTLAGEFPNNLYARALLAPRGAQLVECAWGELPGKLNHRTRLVVLSTVNYATGFRPELQELAGELRRRRILFYLDGTQSVGALPMDVARLRPDMLAVDAYKWLLAPNGAAFAYVDPELRERLQPNVVGWRSHKDWRRVAQLHQGVPVWPEGSERYEGGMIAFPCLYALDASAGLLLELGPEQVEARVMELAGKLRDELRSCGARLLYDEGAGYESPIVAARFEGVDAAALAGQLKQRGILVSARYENLRVSVHLYNDEADILQLSSASSQQLSV